MSKYLSVSELIAQLMEFDPDLPVRVESDAGEQGTASGAVIDHGEVVITNAGGDLKPWC